MSRHHVHRPPRSIEARRTGHGNLIDRPDFVIPLEVFKRKVGFLPAEGISFLLSEN